jgi:hypothetical protein
MTFIVRSRNHPPFSIRYSERTITDQAVQVALSISVPTIAVLVGILINNSRLSDLRSYMESRFSHVDTRFDDLKGLVDARFATAHAELMRVEQVMDARLKHLEER